MAELILSTLPGDREDQRVAVVLRQEAGQSVVRLCQQTFSEAVGWFTQSSVDLAPDQVAGLKNSLGSTEAAHMTGRIRPVSRISGSSGQARILAFPA